MQSRDIIVMGGSSGSTVPLKSILASLPAGLPASVFVVVHLSSRGIGILSTVASAASRLPVKEAQEGLKVEHGCIYLGTPDRHLLLQDGTLHLGRGPRENLARPSIDALFRSAAVAFGPRVIGVVLSGTLNDGSAGLSAIRRCGGLAVVQSPADAIADEMPRHALEATGTDLIAPASELGPLLVDLISEPAGPSPPVPPELRLEVAIASGFGSDSDVIAEIADPVALTCPDCSGVLSVMRGQKPLRFRCQVGHCYTAESLAHKQSAGVDEALQVALRIIEERAELVRRMADEGRTTGRAAVARMYDERADEYRRHAEVIRRTLLESFGSTVGET